MKKFILLFLVTLAVAQNNGIRSLNGSLNNSQRLTVDTSSSVSQFKWTLSNGIHTLNIPYRIANLSAGGSIGNADSLGGLPASSYLLKSDSTIVSAGYGIGISRSLHTTTVSADTTILPTKANTNIWSGTQYYLSRIYGTSTSFDTVTSKVSGNMLVGKLYSSANRSAIRFNNTGGGSGSALGIYNSTQNNRRISIEQSVDTVNGNYISIDALDGDYSQSYTNTATIGLSTSYQAFPTNASQFYVSLNSNGGTNSWSPISAYSTGSTKYVSMTDSAGSIKFLLNAINGKFTLGGSSVADSVLTLIGGANFSGGLKLGYALDTTYTNAVSKLTAGVGATVTKYAKNYQIKLDTASLRSIYVPYNGANASVNLGAQSLTTTGNITGDGIITRDNAGSTSYQLVGDTVSAKDIVWYARRLSGDSARWVMRVGEAENGSLGSNTGSNFSLLRRADNGTLAGTVLSINRSTGNWTYETGKAHDFGSSTITTTGAGSFGAGIFSGAITQTGSSKAIDTTSVNKTLSASNYTIICSPLTNITITLPASASNVGRIYNIKKINSTGASVTIDGNSAETIDGNLTITFNTQWTSYQIQSTGTAWVIL